MPTGPFTKWDNSISGAAVNNAIRDPLQGFDCDVWAVDQATGNQVLVGRFTSLQITIRNASEPYMELNQRVPRILDGEFQFGWVMERGLLDTRILEDTFGIPAIQREMRISRSPRFLITFDMNAPELNENHAGQGINGALAGTDGSARLNQKEIFSARVARGREYRKAVGQYRLTYCKVDSLTMGVMAGRSVVATRWEGLAEGISFFDDSDIWAGTTLSTATQPIAGVDSTYSLDGDIARVDLEPVNNGRPQWLTETSVRQIFSGVTGADAFVNQ